MGRHKEWRVLAKKQRRKRIRQKRAKERDEVLAKEQELREKSPRYIAWKAEQDELEQFQQEEEERLRLERHKKWEEEEVRSQQLWIERQEHLARITKERAQQELLIRQEWEEQQKKEREAEELKQKIKEEKERRQEEILKQIDDFINKGGEVPTSINISTETHPDKPACPFFGKTGACRFGDRCSRNHLRPGISNVLLIPNFYSHFGMHQSMQDEYDTDLLLEYEDSETYQHFKDFFDDVLPEFEEYGRITQFKVCCNFEPHLRGNVYVEYENVRHSVAAFRKFHGRWYGGRQINVEFTCVASWKSAICGLFFKGRCPKGKSCNFLHVFRNPGNLFFKADRDLHRARQQRKQRKRSRSMSLSPDSQDNWQRGERENWRWSESPEPVENNSDDKKHRKERHKHNNSSDKKQRKKGHSKRHSSERSNRSQSSSRHNDSKSHSNHKHRRRRSRSRS